MYYRSQRQDLRYQNWKYKTCLHIVVKKAPSITTPFILCLSLEFYYYFNTYFIKRVLLLNEVQVKSYEFAFFFHSHIIHSFRQLFILQKVSFIKKNLNLVLQFLFVVVYSSSTIKVLKVMALRFKEATKLGEQNLFAYCRKQRCFNYYSVSTLLILCHQN